jgi:alpha-L-arabinofuranosidase
MTQCEVILTAMLGNKNKEEWTASDFQQGEYFVGYEASARMSDLMRLYPNVFIVGKAHRFRTLKINWEAEETQKLLKRYKLN